MGFRTKTTAALLASALALGCSADAPPVKRYPLTGQILGIRSEARELLVKHDDIKGFMPAMTMPYEVRDVRELEGKVPGDLISATLEVGETKAYLSGVTRTGHADLPTTPTGPTLTGVALLEEGHTVPEEIFLDQDGTARPFSTFRGHTVALTFTYTTCPMPDFCPLMDCNFATVQVALKKSPELAHVRLVTATVDPVHDTPPVLARHMQGLRADPAVWTFLTGDDANLAHFAAQFGVSVMRDAAGQADITHNLRTVVIDPEGRVTKIFTGNGWTPSELLAALKAVPAPAR